MVLIIQKIIKQKISTSYAPDVTLTYTGGDDPSGSGQWNVSAVAGTSYDGQGLASVISLPDNALSNTTRLNTTRSAR